MTDRIDLDDYADGDGSTESSGESVWRDDAGVEPEEPDGAVSTSDDAVAADESAGAVGDRVPHVPRPNQGSPAGIPVESGGAGAGAGSTAESPPDEADDREADGPHGGGIDDLTLALTYDAARALSNPRRVIADARGWADWIGVVGRVDAPVLNKFQRDEGVDLDFFNGSGTEPGERLADIDEHSMFFAERMVVVGVDADDEDIASRAGWEFVSLEEAAAEAGWDVSLRDKDL